MDREGEKKEGKNKLKDLVRRAGIAARERLSQEDRERLSLDIVKKLSETAAFKGAKTVMVYASAKAEVMAELLCGQPGAEGKRFAFPRCVSREEMVALVLEDDSAWETGRFGIRELAAERSKQAVPEEIDLVVCPCTAFDVDGRRMGMGGGFYDRYLPKCTGATVVAVAFEVQKTEEVPADRLDVAMDFVVTEKGIYQGLRRKR